jgi:hypothetical protein
MPDGYEPDETFSQYYGYTIPLYAFPTQAVMTGLLDWTSKESLEDVGGMQILVRTYTVVYSVKGVAKYSDPNKPEYIEPLMGDTPRSVMEAAGLPMPYSACPFDPECRCISKSAKKRHDPKEKGEYWEVTCEFTSKPSKFCMERAIEDPLMQPPVVTTSTRTVRRTARFNFVTTFERKVDDIWVVPGPGLPPIQVPYEYWAIINYPRPLLMSNGMLMDDVEVDSTEGQVSITYNSAMFDPSVCYGLLNHTNYDPMWGHFPGTIEYSGFSWSTEYYGTCLMYYKLSFTFDVKGVTGYTAAGDPQYGYYQWIADHGQLYIPDGVDNVRANLRPARTADGSGLMEVFLDGDGHALPGQVDSAGYGTNTTFDPSTVFIHQVQPYPMANLLLLGVPPDLIV